MLDEEHDTSNFHKEPKDPNEYILGRVGGHNIVLAWLPGEQGKGAAAVVATHLDRSFGGIQWRFLVGIGGGVPSERHDIRLGDVVISMPERQYSGAGQYDLGRETENGYEPKGFLHAPPAYLRSVVGKMRSNHLAASNQIATLQYRRPPDATDILFQDDVPHSSGPRSCGQCDLSRTVNREVRDAEALVEVHYGLIASGDAVIVSNTSRNEKIDKLGGDVLCFDMEAGGVLSTYECLVIRGISNFAHQHKMRGWRQYAAATAAACAKEVLLLPEYPWWMMLRNKKC
ncbi:purine and uridine phosphorylase [Sarocladium strictum]